MGKISVTTQITLKDYINVSYYTFYRKWTTISSTIMGLLMLFLSLTILENDKFFIPLVLGLFLVFFLPISMYFTLKKIYNSHNRLKEQVLYEFDEDNMTTTGQSFSSTLSLENLYSVTESKNYILVWTSSRVASIIPKRNFSGEQLQLFKSVFLS